MDFQIIKTAVTAQFAAMQQHPLFRVDITGDELWAAYLAAFPDGTNLLFRERTEHDCSCCKQFIRTIGNVVALTPTGPISMWETTIDGPYRVVADTLAKLVLSKPIVSPFLHYERSVGTDKNFEEITGQSPRRWDHFHVNLLTQFVAPKDSIPTKLGELRTKAETFKRALDTITFEAVDTVLELIAQNTLYRGAEHKATLTKFHAELTHYTADEHKDDMTYVWRNYATLPGSVTGIRNTSIGTLLVDLSEGMELDAAVRKFEAMVAPTHYKRPTAIVTPKMIEQAKAKIAELGLMSALERRFAALPDLTINNVLFADRSARKAMDNVFDDLAASTSARAKVSDKVEEIGIEQFIANVLPKVDSIEVLLENKHAGNMVSLIAPVDPTAGRLFKWANNFSWSYSGEMADSIKEKVKAAGGNVTGDLCCRLAWYNSDDLDLHLVGPNGKHIYYGNRGNSRTGKLDVDANGQDGIRPNPVENIFFQSREHITQGEYHLYVNQFNPRSTADIGFEAEIDFMGQVTSFAYDKRQVRGENVTIARFRYSQDKGFEIIESLPSKQAVRNVWGLPTQTFHKVNVLCLSPNYWDDQAGIGNKHFFFMLNGCVNDGTARGFFNEFLDSRLDPHRKVFEMVGGKMKPADTPNQLSGVGFSSTQRNTLTVRVKGSFTRTLNVNF